MQRTRNILEVILKPNFAVWYCVTMLLVIATSYIMDKPSKVEKGVYAFLVHPDFYLEYFSFVCFFATAAYSASGRITSAVVQGDSIAIDQKRLSSMCFPFSLICGKNGERSMLVFVSHSIAFPGLTIFVILHLCGWVAQGNKGLWQWKMLMHDWIAWNVLWKYAVATCIYVLNYLAAHNSSQSILTVHKDD